MRRNQPSKLFVRSTFTLAISLALSAHAIGETWNVRQFGAVGDGRTDDRPAIQRTIDAAIHSGQGSRIVIPAGKYFLGKDEARDGQLLISAAQSLKIVGSTDSLLISGAPQRNIFAIENSTNIRISHLQIDRRPLLFTQGVVRSIDTARDEAIIDIDPAYEPPGAPLIAPQKWFIVYSDPSSGTWGDHSVACAYNNPGDPLACWPPIILRRTQITPREWQVTLNTPPEPNYVGHRFVIWSGTYKGRAFLIQHSRNISIEEVAYYGGGADGFAADHNRGTLLFRRFTIGIPPGSDRLLAATGGGMVFNNHAHVVLDHVNISHSWDDSLNIGANFARIYQQLGPNEIRVDGSRSDFVLGDELSVWDWRAKAVTAHPRILKMACDPDRSCRLTLDQTVVIAHPGYAPVKSKGNDTDGIDRVIDLTSVGTLHVENSIFQSLHARCLLIKASQSIVEHPVCYDTVIAGFLVGPQFFWDEGPEVDSLTIRDNEFRNVSGANILVTNGGSAVAPPTSNLSISGNHFVNYGHYRHGVDVRSGDAILLQNTSNPIITGNQFATKYKPECCKESIGKFAASLEIK